LRICVEYSFRILGENKKNGKPKATLHANVISYVSGTNRSYGNLDFPLFLIKMFRKSSIAKIVTRQGTKPVKVLFKITGFGISNEADLLLTMI
jgi:hypothetical protein